MNPGDIIWIVAGAVLVALGGLVLLRCRSLSAGAFGVFAVGLGSLYAILAWDAPVSAVVVANLVIMVGYWTMFLVFPTRLARGEGRLLVIAFLVGAVASAPHYLPRIQASVFLTPDAFLMQVLYYASYVGILAGVVLFPLRARRLGPAARSAARSLAAISVGVALFRGFDAAVIIAAARGEQPLTVAIVPLLVFALPPILWVLVAARGAHARLARNTVLAHVAVVLAALLGWRVEGGAAMLGLGGALLLGFGVLRGQIQGLDLKVRWTISKSTVAAVFVAVFFVASEFAQQFLGETTGSAYLGIAAAGALVFALAPLQRAAEGLAAKAVPVAEAPLQMAEAHRAYRRHVEVAWSDGRLGAKERLLLQEARQSLRIDLDEADRIEQEVARRTLVTGVDPA